MSQETATDVARATYTAFLNAQKDLAEAEKAFTVAQGVYRKACADAEKKVGAASGNKIAFQCADGLRHFSPVRGGGFAFKKFLPGWTTDGKTVVDVTDLG